MPTEDPQAPPAERASVTFARMMGLPDPKPFTNEEEAAFQRKMDEADAAIAARLAREGRQSA